MQHNAYYGPPSQWVVYEREEGGLASIWGLRVDMANQVWGTEVVRISGAFCPGKVRLPDVAGTPAYGGIVLRVVAWEQWASGAWNIWYSIRSDTDEAWSSPCQLTADTVDNTGVQLRPLEEGYVLATWRRGKDLLCCRIGSAGRVDPLQVGASSEEGFEFDVHWLSQTGFIWTTKDPSGNNFLSYRYLEFSYLGEPVWTASASLALPFSIRNPWFIIPLGRDRPLVEFEADSGGRSRVFYFDPPDHIEDLSTDTTADFGNPRGIFTPVISLEASNPAGRPSFVGYGFDVIEYRGESDSSLIFWPGGSGMYSDTLRQPGQNRGVVVGSPAHSRGGAEWYPVVWQSNRSGRWHLYGTFVLILVGDVDPYSGTPEQSSLSQNYPNPFNASTTIKFALSHAGYATLKVYNVLGEEVGTLIEGEHTAGTFKATWDASGEPSGVYFYRLSVGEYFQTKKAVLMR